MGGGWDISAGSVAYISHSWNCHWND